MGLVDEGEGRLRAATDDGHDPVARREERDGAPDTHDLAGHLHARDVLRPARWRRVVARPLRDVGAVDASRPDLHQQLGVAGDGILALLIDQVAVPDHHCLHVGHPRHPTERVSDRSALG